MNSIIRILSVLVLTLSLVACAAANAPTPTPAVVAPTGATAPSPIPTGAAEPTPPMVGMDHGADAMEGGMGDMMAGVDELAALQGEAFDIAFLDMMIPHHRSALDMAQIALERAERPEVREAAQAIVDAQEAEIAQMTGWLQEWYGREPTGMGHGMGMDAEVEALRVVADEEFDVAFLQAMIPHHQGAIAMAELVPDRTARPELLDLSEAIITSQQAEIDEFRGWIEAWSAG